MIRAPRPITMLTAAFLVAACLVAACSGDPKASVRPSLSTAPGEPSAWQPENAWQRALGAIGDDGHFSLQAALDLFATVFGPVPGSTAAQDLTGVFELTLAVNAVMEHEGELSAEQRAAIDRYLEPPAGSTTIVIPSSAETAAAHGVQLVEITDERTAKLKAVAAGYRHTIALAIGFDIPYWEIVWAPRPDWIKPTAEGVLPNGMSGPHYDGSGENDMCRTTIFTEASGEVDHVLEALLAHEVFHCFQFKGYGTEDKFKAAPVWVIEGQPSWVGQTVGGPSGKYDPMWNSYLLVPTKRLTQRAYDAIGFYGHLQRQFELSSTPEQAIASMWGALKAQWGAGGSSAAAFDAAGAGSTGFLESWASGVMRDGDRGAAWETSGPGITTSAYPGRATQVNAGAPVDVGREAFTNEVWELQLNTDLVQFLMDGPSRLNDGSIDTTALKDVWYCVEGHDCAPNPGCPQAFLVPETAGTLSSFALLAATGQTTGTGGTIIGIDIPKSCQSLVPPSAPTPNPLAKATVRFTSGLPPMTGGWCKVGTDPEGASYFTLWFVGPGNDAFDIAVESASPIKAGPYYDAPDALGVDRHITSTIRQGDFYHNLKLELVTLEGTTDSGSFAPTGGTFAGTYNDGDRGAAYISGKFECHGEQPDFDWATGVLNYGSLNAKGVARTVSLEFSADSDTDGSNPGGIVTVLNSEYPNDRTRWATVECLNVIGDAFGLVVRTHRALSPLESVGLPRELNVPVVSYLFFGGRQDAASPDRDPSVVKVVSGTGSCAPTLHPLDHQESAVAVHDAP